MAISDPFKDFQLYNPSFQRQDVGSIVGTTQPAAPVTRVATPFKMPKRLDNAYAKLSAPVETTPAPATKGTTQTQTATGGTDPATGQPYEPIPKANTGGPGPGSQVPTGETDPAAPPPTNDPFDYEGYGDLPTGPITDNERANWSGDTRNRFDALQKTIDSATAEIDRINKMQGMYRDMTTERRMEERARMQRTLDTAKAEQETLLNDFRSTYATEHAGDQWLDSLTEIISNWGTQYTDDTTVEPFQSEWANVFGNVFGDLTDFGSSTDFLQSFMNNFGLDEIITGQVNWGDYGFQNYSPDALKKFIESGANIPGYDYDPNDPNITDEQEFIKFSMQTAKDLLAKMNSSAFDKEGGILGKARNTRLEAALKLYTQPGMTEQEKNAILKRNMLTVERDAEQQKRETDYLIGTQLAGQSTKSAYYHRQVDRDVMMARAQAEGDIAEMDVNLRQQNMQKAIEEFGSISRDEMTGILEEMKIQGTKEGQILNYLAEVGRIALGSKDTEYSHYENKLKMAQDFYLQNSDRILREELGKAELDLKQFDITTTAGLEQMRLAYQTALQNRGMNIEEAVANSNQLLETYKIGQSFAKMDMDRLTTMADLAAKAQEGDRQAWGAYQSMMLEERLKNRGMNIDEAQSLAQLTYGIWTTEKQQALTMWVERYRGQLERELAQMEIDSRPSPWLQAVGNLFGGIGQIVPFLKRGTTTTTTTTGTDTPDIYTPPGDYNTGTEGNA